MGSSELRRDDAPTVAVPIAVATLRSTTNTRSVGAATTRSITYNSSAPPATCARESNPTRSFDGATIGFCPPTVASLLPPFPKTASQRRLSTPEHPERYVPSTTSASPQPVYVKPAAAFCLWPQWCCRSLFWCSDNTRYSPAAYPTKTGRSVYGVVCVGTKNRLSFSVA